MNKYKAVIFDLDNTLCDTISAIRTSMRVCYKYLKNHYPDITFEQFMDIEEKIFIRLTIEQKLPVYSFRALYWHEIFAELKLAPSPILIKNMIQLYSDQIAKTVELFDGVEELLIELKAMGLKLAILSNGDFQTKAAMVEYLNISKCFDLIVASDITQVDKPDPKAFIYVLKQLGLEAPDCVMVGDERTNDVEGSRILGMTPVYACWPEKNSGKSLEDIFCANTPQDILDLVKVQ